MKKFLIGIIVGAVLSFSASVYADDIASLVGKEIQGEFPVKVNGEKLANNAAVVDGTSYLPVRAIGDALNMEVSFDPEQGIELKEKVEQAPVTDDKLTVRHFSKAKLDLDKVSEKNGEFSLAEANDDQYVVVGVLGGTWNKPFITVESIKGEKYIIQVLEKYEAGAEAFILDGNVFIKLSPLGLKATVSGDTLVIVKL